jgi:TolA-binding protein
MKSVLAALFALSLSCIVSAQSYGNNYGYDPSIQQRTQDMMDRQMQQQQQQYQWQQEQLQRQQMQQSVDQMRYQQQWNNMRKSRPCYGYDC